jgi:dihydropteroate synthase
MTIEEYYQWQSVGYPRTLLMGILNVTPDSFSDGGQYFKTSAALQHARDMIQNGADIIDIGGESTRPGADPVAPEEELNRIIPLIQDLRSEFDGLISVDTYKSSVAEQALESGASLINDISGLSFDPQMARVAAQAAVPVVIMHIKGTPRDMQTDPRYSDLMDEIKTYFRTRIEQALNAGIKPENIILDPGIGFGKRLEDNFELIRKLEQIVAMGYPVLLGPSRKSLIGQVLNLPVEERLEGTAAAVTAGVLAGARIMRVHDVQAMKRVITIADKIAIG